MWVVKSTSEMSAGHMSMILAGFCGSEIGLASLTQTISPTL